MNPITIPNITIPTIGIPTIGIPSVGFPSASGGGLAWPAGLKESIKAIYDPASQGMTNYDVIESYIEDFTTWNYLSSRGSATVTTNKIIITKSFGNTQNIIEDNKSPYDDIKIYVTGISEDNPLTINQYVDNKWVRLHTYTTDGIYIVKNRNLYVGFGTYTTDDCNITITQLPTSILKDLSGNGNHAYLYGGKGKLNSGMGVYQIDFTSYSKTSVVADVSHNTVKVVPAANNYLFVRYATTEMPAYTVNVQNLGNNVLTYQYATENGRREITLTEGINEIPESIKTEEDYQVGFRVNAGTGEITITQIPDYPNSLCYAGKQYCKAYGLPILDDYTIIARRIWFDKTDIRCLCSKYKDTTVKPGLFRFEWTVNNSEYTSSLGKNTSVTFSDSITWQTKTSYNGKALTNLSYEDGEHLIIGDYAKKIGNYYIGCHDDIIILKRSLTINEINDITEAIFNETIIEE